MIYAKFINENSVKRFRNPAKVGGVVYSNPTSETLSSLGYLPVIEMDKSQDKEGYCTVPKYRIDGNKILQEWCEVENEFEV